MIVVLVAVNSRAVRALSHSICRQLQKTPPRPRELTDAVNACLKAADMPPMTSAEQEPYARFYAMYNNNTDADLESDSFISDVSTNLDQLSLSEPSHRSGAGGVGGAVGVVPVFEEGDWDFYPFGAQSSVDVAAALAAGIMPPCHPQHSRKPSGMSQIDDLDLNFQFDSIANSRDSAIGATISPLGCP